MCFGPVASFAASACLTGVGTAVVKSTRTKKELLFAAFPFLFAIQQFIEGIIWLLLKEAKHDSLIQGLSIIYLFFAYSVWPVLCPLSVAIIEPDPKRRKLFHFLLAVGIVTSAYLFYFTLVNPRITSVLGCSIRYKTFIPEASWFLGAYGAATILPYFLSSHRSVLAFGIPNLILCIFSFIAYQSTFISVWCFFAALISVNLLFFVKHLHKTQMRGEAAVSGKA